MIKEVRETKETKVEVLLELYPEKGSFRGIEVDTEVGFLDHMLEVFAFHSGIALKLSAKGDTWVDYHHTVEDVGIVLGRAIYKALGERKRVTRFGEAFVPLEEALSQAVIDLAKRPYLVYLVNFNTEKIGNFDVELIEEFFRALVMNGCFTLHLRNLYGKNSHHIAETLFKAFAKAFREAIKPTDEETLSTKGTL